MNKNTIAITIIIAIIGLGLYFGRSNKSEPSTAIKTTTMTDKLETTTQPKKKTYDKAPVMALEEGVDYSAIIKTNKGDIHLDLFEKETPITVNNFVFLAEEGFYNGTIFHRVIADFMVQGGDPLGTGTGGPGYRFEDEVDTDRKFTKRGQLAMANAGPGTNGSQFFITLVSTDWLTGNHTIFGEITEGDDVLAAITIREPGSSTPADIINEIEIVKK